MLTEQPACKNLDGLSIIGQTGWGRSGAPARFCFCNSESHHQFLSTLVRRTSGRAGQNRAQQENICISNALGGVDGKTISCSVRRREEAVLFCFLRP